MTENTSSISQEAIAGPDTPSFEDIIRVSPKELDEILRKDHFHIFWLGDIGSGRVNIAESVSDLVANIDACLELFDLTGDKLTKSFIEKDSDGQDWNPIRKSEIESAVAANRSIGSLYLDRAYYSLDIEGDEYGYTEIGSLDFKIPGDRRLCLEVTGDFWTDRVYKHPVTGQPYAPFHDEDVYELSDTLGREIELISSEVNYVLDFEGRIDRDLN